MQGSWEEAAEAVAGAGRVGRFWEEESGWAIVGCLILAQGKGSWQHCAPSEAPVMLAPSPVTSATAVARACGLDLQVLSVCRAHGVCREGDTRPPAVGGRGTM